MLKFLGYPRRVVALLLALIGTAPYLSIPFFGFIYLDDYLIVQQQGYYAKLGNVVDAFFRSLWNSKTSAYAYYRPISESSYILAASASKAIWGEVTPVLFHVTNLVLHFSVVVLMYLVLTELGAVPLVAAFSCLLFAFHPVWASVVSWVGGQNELLLTCFVLVAFFSFLRALASEGKTAARLRWIFLHGFFFFCALLTKENAVGIPILCCIHLMATGRFRENRTLGLGLAGTWIIAAIAWWLLMRQVTSSSLAEMGGKSLESILGSLPYLLVYLGKLLVPFPLRALPTWEDTSVFTLIAGGVAAVLVPLAGYFAKTKQSRGIVLIGTLWFLGFLLPTFIRLGPVADAGFVLREDRCYLASVGLILIFSQMPWPRFFKKPGAWAVSGALAVILLGLNLVHQFDYRDGMSFYESAAEGSPHLAFARAHLGDMYIAAARYPDAIGAYTEALRLNPREPEAHNNLGVVYLRTGKFDLAASEFQSELNANPINILSLYNIGTIYFNKGAYADAEKVWRRAVELNPAYSDAWNGLIAVYTALKDEPKRAAAEQQLREKGEWDMTRGI